MSIKEKFILVGISVLGICGGIIPMVMCVMAR